MPGKYYLIAENERRGPFSKEELESQGLRRDTLVWCKGQPDWIAAGRVPELVDVFDEPPPLPGATPFPEHAALPSEHVKDPAVNVPHSEAVPPVFRDDHDSLSLLRRPWRIPYDAVGMRRLYVGAMATYVPGLVLVLLAGALIAWLGIHGVQMHTPRFDPVQKNIVTEFDFGARTLETLLGVLAASMMILGVIGLAIGAACFFVVLYRAWSIVYDGRTGPSPARQIGFLFIPFFNVYWVFVALWGLARRLNRMARYHDLDVPTASQPLGFAICIYSCLTYLPFPFAGLFPLGLNLILWPFFMRSIYRTTAAMCEDANRERIEQARLDGGVRQLDLPRPVSAHILSIAALALAPIATAAIVISYGVYLDALRHYDRDIPMNAAQRQALEHLRGLNPPDPNRLQFFENGLRNTEHQLMRWREELIISGAVLLGGVFLLAIVFGLAHVARLCARAGEDAVPPAPSAWPAPHGAGF
jgi:hypothetical protein